MLWAIFWRLAVTCFALTIFFSALPPLIGVSNRIEWALAGPCPGSTRNWFAWTFSLAVIIFVELSLFIIATLVIKLIWLGITL
jgi:hypothetical protein